MSRPMDTREIEPGNTVLVGPRNGPQVELKICAIVQSESNGDPMALLWLSGRRLPEEVVAVSKSGSLVGQVVPLSTEFPKAKEISPMFALLRFSNNYKVSIAKETSIASVSKRISRHAFDKHSNVKVKSWRADNISIQAAGRKHNSHSTLAPRKGFVVGDATNSFARAGDDVVQMPLTVLARGKGRRAFAKQGDGGLPVLSKTNALVGFVVGEDAGYTSLLPADVLGEIAEMRFLTFGRDPIMHRKNHEMQPRFVPKIAAE